MAPWNIWRRNDGARTESIEMAEDRELFRKLLTELALSVPALARSIILKMRGKPLL